MRPALDPAVSDQHAVRSLEVKDRLVGDASQLGHVFGGDVAAHEPDEGDPDGKRLAAVLEDGAREGGESPPAEAAAHLETPVAGRSSPYNDSVGHSD